MDRPRRAPPVPWPRSRALPMLTLAGGGTRRPGDPLRTTGQRGGSEIDMGSYDELGLSLEAALERVALAAMAMRLERREVTRHADARAAAEDEHGSLAGVAWLAHSAAHDALERLRASIDALEGAASAADELARTLAGDLVDDASAYEHRAARARCVADELRERSSAAARER